MVKLTSPQLMNEGSSSFLRAARAGNLEKVLEYLNGSLDINTSNMNGMNALHLASKEGHSEMVKELLKRGANVNAGTNKGNTALHIASLGGKLEVVEILVENGANVNAQSLNGFTPLYMAAQENHDTVVRYLLSHGANQSLATEDGFTPLAVALQQGHDKVVTILLENDTKGKVRLPALHIAAKKDDCKAAALLLQSDQKPDVTSKSGFTPLHIAAHYGNENIGTLLLDKGANINFTAKHKITPLHVAAKWGKAHMVQLLLDRGAQIDAATRDGLTPLHCAARSGHEPVVDLLLKRGAPYSAKTKNGLAPLHMASQGDHIDSARTLLAYKAPVDDVTVDFLTPLHVAAHCGHVKVAKLLLDHKANVNARALNGFVPLHIACKKNRIKVVELLLKHGASIEVTTESGLTPLHVASFMGCINIVIYLIQNGADVDGATVRGETPIHLAARASQSEIIKILLRNGALVDKTAREDQTALHIASRLNNTEIVQLLLTRGASVDVATRDQYTALHIASKEGHREVAAYLLEQGASLTATTKKGFTPLHLAAKYGKITVAGLLLEKEAPVDAQGKNGVTPLHVAAHYDFVDVAILLLVKGASPHATAKNGYTPLHIAAKKKQIEIATTLLEYGADTNAESKAGFTPLHLAAQEGHTDMGELLISHKANVNAKSKLELTPLHLAAQGDRVAVAQVLLKKRADVNVQTKQGYTPLHVACHNGAVGMIKLLLQAGANVDITTQHGYTPLHQAAQQGHTLVINLLLDHKASPNKTTNLGYTPLAIAQKCNYISVVETLKTVTEVTTTSIITTTTGEKYSYNNPETMQETFMTTDSEDEGGEGADNWEKANLNYEKGDGGEHDESFGFDVTHDESISRAGDLTAHAPLIADETISPSHIIMQESMINNFTPDNIDIFRPPTSAGRLKWKTFLVSFMVDARGGAMRGCRHSGVRVIIPPRKAPMPMRITCRYLRREKLIHPPPLMEGEACASRILEIGPSGAKFLGPVIIEVPHFAAMRGKEREIIILRSDDGESWREHSVEASEDTIREILNDSLQGESDLNNLDSEFASDRITRILTTDFPQYFAIITRIRQEVHAIGPEGGMVNSTVVPQVQAIFPEGALTKKIKVGLQAQPISSELVAKMLGNRVAVSPIVTVEPRRRKFHKPITLTIPVPQAATRGMINNYTGDTPTLRLLCSITGGTSKAQWEDVTGSTPLTFVNQCVSFTTTVSARFWLMDCRQINEATKFATDLYREATAVPFMSKFVVFSKRHDPSEAQMRIFCMTDDKEEKTLENQEQFTEVAKSRDVEVLEGKCQYLEFAGNLIPVTKSGEQLNLTFQAFRENRLPFLIRVRDSSQEPFGKIAFMKEPRKTRGEAPQVPICNLNIKLPEIILEEEPIVINNYQQQFTDVHYNIKSETIQRSALDDDDIILNADPSIMQMGQELGKDWIKVASHLDVDPIDTEKIKRQFNNLESEQATALLYNVDRKSSIWQNKQLCKALWDIGRKDLVTKFYPEHKNHLAEFGIKLNGKQNDEPNKTIESSKSLPTEREVTLDDKDIMKDAESMDDSEGEPGILLGQSTVTATANKIPSHETKGREDEERASAVQQYLKYLEDEDREDSEERAAFRGEKTNSNELYIIKEEIQVPSGDSSSIKSTNQISITSPESTHETESHIKTEENIEFTDEGGLTHSITQVTKTTIIQDTDEPIQVQQRLQKQQQSQPQDAQGKQQESGYSNEPDTISQVSISSIPEDDKSDPTSANISSATTTTTNASDVRMTTEEPGTKITVEQNGNSVNHEEFNLIAETIIRQVYDEVFELIRTKKITIDDKEWFETEASGDVVHIIEQSTTCERTNDKSDLIADENDHEMSYSEKKDYFTKLSNDSKVKPVPPASHYCRSSSIETSGMGKDDRRPSEGEIVETVGAFNDRRAYFEATGGRRSYSIDIANMDEARTAYSTSLVQRSTGTKGTSQSTFTGLTEKLEEEEDEENNSKDARQVNQICTSQLTTTTTTTTISESLMDNNVDFKSTENRLSSLIKPEAGDNLNGSLSPREPDLTVDYDQENVSKLVEPFSPEIVDKTSMEQIISPNGDFPDYLTTEVKVKVGPSPPTEVNSKPIENDNRNDIDSTDMIMKRKGDKLESESVDYTDEVIIETGQSMMAFDNSAFEGADTIDSREELDDGAVSPFEIVRDETNDIPSTRPSLGSPITDSEALDDEIMRQLESERVEYSDSPGQGQNGSLDDFNSKQLVKSKQDLIDNQNDDDVDTVFITSTDLLQNENKLSADCDDKSSTIVHHGSSQLHSASEIEENVVVWETTIHQHSIEIQDEVSEMTSNGMKVRLEEKINEEIDKSESTDSTSLKKEARELANQIVGQVKEKIESQAPLKIIESVEISDEDLVELSDELSTATEETDKQQLKENDDGKSGEKSTNQPEEFQLIQDSESSEKFRIEKHETSEIIVDADGQEYLITETRTTEERIKSETTIKQDEISSDGEPIVKMRVKTNRNQSDGDFGSSGSGKDQRFSTDSDRLASLSATGASLSSTPTSSDRKFVSCLSQSPGSSRPTSSEFDHLVPGFGHGHGGSWTGPSGSEYETAATSQESSSYISANQAATSGESTSYVTAKSSRESTISVDSDHSFNYTDSETSETLMMGNFAHDGQTPVPQAENNANHSIGVGKSAKDNDEDEEDEDEDGSLTPVINDLNSSLVKESYESIIPEDVTRSEIEAPLMSGSCNWELIEKPENQSNPSSPFEIVPISSEQITELMEETPEKMLGEKVSAVPGLPTESTETSTSATISTVSTTTTITTTIKSGTSQGSGFDDNDQPSISDGSATWLSSSLGTIVGMGNSSLESSTGGQLSDRFGGNGGSGQVSGLTDSINSFDLIGQSSDNNLGTGDALSSLESQGHSLTTNLTSNQIVTSITTITTMTTTTIVTSSSPEMLALVSGSDAVEISDFERYDVDRSSLDDFSPGLRLPEHGNDNLGGSLSSVNDINEIPSEAAANDTPLISQSSVASSILSEQTRHQLSYDLSPEIPCQGSGGETLTQRSDDTQLFSDGDGTRPQSPIPPADFGSNVVVGTSMGMYDTWEEKSPCSDDTDMCMVMTPSVSDVNMPPPLTPFLPPLTGHSSGNGLTGNPIEGLIELGRIEEEEDEFGLITGSSKNVSNVNNNTTSSDDYRPMTLGFDRSKPIPVSSIITGHITTVAEGSHEGSSTGSSLQEFEKLEAEVTSSKVAHGVRPSHHGSSDSIGSFGSIGGKPLHGKGSQGDDSLSVNSLMEFEKLESECRDAEVIESAARDEAARLSEIEEGHESQASDSQETLSDQGNSDEENADIEKRIKELDEMIEVTKPINPNETKKNP